MSTLRQPERVWTEAEWAQMEASAASALLAAEGEAQPRLAVAPYARRVMRTYTSSFFIVTRFLPASKRRDVEIIYANVRYPDEVVDTFPLTPEDRLARLDAWESAYDRALQAGSAPEAVRAGVPAFLAAMVELIRAYGIPEEHYRSFLQAMRADVHPRLYADMQALVDDYVYGSAVVVGYFLAHVFGPSEPAQLDDALRASRELGIALQMTNFLRDVGEDLSRGRIYLPCDRLREEGLDASDPASLTSRALSRVVTRLARENDSRYASALQTLPLFAPDSRQAIEACIRVYRLLNEQLASATDVIAQRASVPFSTKFRALPLCKYWVLPRAYLLERP
jgi:phytoene synthase